MFSLCCLQKLPEELIKHLVSYIKIQSTLAAISGTSRELHRIVELSLYIDIEITVNTPGVRYQVPIMSSVPVLGQRQVRYTEFDTPTRTGSAAIKFIRSLTERPELIQYVKAIKLVRYDTGQHDRHRLGLYGTQNQLSTAIDMIQAAARTEHPIEMSKLQQVAAVQRTEDEISSTVQTLLRLVPQIIKLDCSQYINHVPWNIFLKTQQKSRIKPSTLSSFSNLQYIEIACGSRGLHQLEPLFRMTNVRCLHLHGLRIRCPVPINSMQEDHALQPCSITNLFLEDLHLEWLHPDDLSDTNPLYVCAALVNQLRMLHVSMQDAQLLSLVFSAFREKIPQLNELQAYGTSTTSRGSTNVGNQSEDFRNTAVLSAIQASPKLQILYLDFTDLSEAFHLDDFETLGKDPSFDTDQYVKIPQVGGMMRAYLPLPPSVVDLVIHIGDVFHIGPSLTKVLEAVAENHSARTPDLQYTGIVFRVDENSKDCENFMRKLLRPFCDKSVMVEERRR